MIEQIRHGILAVEGAADDIEDEYIGDEKGENEVKYFCVYFMFSNGFFLTMLSYKYMQFSFH